MTFVFKHPKFYRIPRDKTDQVISRGDSTEAGRRAPGPGQSHKPKAASNKPEATSSKQEASSPKLLKKQATSSKP
jgi:hypothetical protein